MGVLPCLVLTLTVMWAAGLPSAAAAGDAASRLCRVTLVSEAEPDMTSVDSILKGIIQPDMTDEQKCLAVYRFVHEHRFWYPAVRPVENGRAVDDPVLIVNCFPALICQQDAAVTSGFWAGLGYDVRYWQLKGHTTGEVFYGGKWRNFDATLGRYKRTPEGDIGDVSVAQGLYKPGISQVEPYDDFEIGHEMHLTLRRGETFTRHWYPLSKERDYWRPGANGEMPDERAGNNRGLAAIMKKKPYRFDTKGSGICNGLWVFEPDLSDGRWDEVFESATNVAASERTLLSPKDAGRPAELVWRMRTPYIITGAWVEAEFLIPMDRDDVLKASVSTNNGATWREVGPVKAGRQKLSLTGLVAGRFCYLLRLTMTGGAAAPVGVRGLKCTTVVQANPLSLPALKEGQNQIRIARGEQTETLTVWPDFETPDYRAEVLQETNIVTAREQLQPAWLTGLCAREGGKESVLVYRLGTPGEIKRVRWGGRFRATKDDLNELFYSVDGKTWRKQELSYRWTFPKSETPNMYPAFCETTDDLPPGTKTVFLKYRFMRPVPRRDTAELHIASALRVDVDYVPPGSTGAGPVEVTYSWAEAEGDKLTEKTHTEVSPRGSAREVATTLPHSYNITVGGEGKPLMRWVRMRIASP